tara:strand:+ start:887 stop:1279 length:393 start_codon:yes stop_codon:yes gene_type:complete
MPNINEYKKTIDYHINSIYEILNKIINDNENENVNENVNENENVDIYYNGGTHSGWRMNCRIIKEDVKYLHIIHADTYKTLKQSYIKQIKKPNSSNMFDISKLKFNIGSTKESCEINKYGPKKRRSMRLN